MVQPPAMTFTDAADAMTQATAAIFSKWTALLLTVEHQQGGNSQRIRDIQQDTINLAMAASPISYDDLVDFFYDEFDRMDTDVEDESPEQVARHIIQIRDALKKGDFGPATEMIQQLTTAPSSHVARSVTNSIPHADDSGEDDGDAHDSTIDDEHVQLAHTEPAVDADGFTEVTRRGRHR